MSRPCRLDVLRRGVSALVAVAAVALVAVACGGGGDRSLGGVSLPALDGGAPVALAGVDDRPVLVNLWAPWCAPCRKELPAFEAVHRELGASVRIVGVSPAADEAGARAMAGELGLTFELGQDVAAAFSERMGVAELPATVLARADGTVVRVHRGAVDEAGLRAFVAELAPG